MKKFAVAIVGAGVMGASVAFHLTQRGVRDIVLLDRAERSGLGSTGRATGGFRAQYATPINVQLSLLARTKLMSFHVETGGDCGYRPAGYLWLATDRDQLSTLAAGVALQQREGLHEARLVGRREIEALNPAIALDRIVGGAYCPTDGFVRPLGLLDGYLTAAQRAGAQVVWNCSIDSVERGVGDRIRRLNSSQGSIDAEHVVNAAGAWAGLLAALCAVPLPVVPLRRQVVPTVATDRIAPSLPMTIFCADGFHLRERDGRVLLLWPTPGVVGDPFDDRVDPAWIDAIETKTRARVPALAGIELDRAAAWGGLYEMSPDKHAVLGLAPNCTNFWLINGSSGHGVMHAPALGQLLAELIIGAKPTLDVHPLRPTRFREGELNPISELL